MKAGDTAYLVESNRFVHEVEILRCNGELYIVCFKDNGVGLYFKACCILCAGSKTSFDRTSESSCYRYWWVYGGLYDPPIRKIGEGTR